MNHKLLLPFLLLIFFNSNAQVFNWITDIDSAISISNKENKPMLLMFTDANSSKDPLFSQIFNTLDFAIWARDNVVAVKLDVTDNEFNGSLERNSLLKKAFGTSVIRHTAVLNREIKKIAVCGGAGAFLTGNAISEGVDAFITADLKYHDFFEADNKILLADIGHYESEQYTIELIRDILTEKFPNFAVLKTGHNTNPVHYFC